MCVGCARACGTGRTAVAVGKGGGVSHSTNGGAAIWKRARTRHKTPCPVAAPRPDPPCGTGTCVSHLLRGGGGLGGAENGLGWGKGMFVRRRRRHPAVHLVHGRCRPQDTPPTPAAPQHRWGPCLPTDWRGAGAAERAGEGAGLLAWSSAYGPFGGTAHPTARTFARCADGTGSGAGPKTDIGTCWRERKRKARRKGGYCSEGARARSVSRHPGLQHLRHRRLGAACASTNHPRCLGRLWHLSSSSSGCQPPH